MSTYDREAYLKWSAEKVKSRYTGSTKHTNGKYYKSVDNPEKPCKNCGNLYKPKSTRSLYCNPKCSKAWHNKDTTIKVERECLTCSKICKRKYCGPCAYDADRLKKKQNLFDKMISGLGGSEDPTIGYSKQKCLEWIYKVQIRGGMVSFEELFTDLITVYFSIGGKLESGVGKPSRQLMRMWRICMAWYIRNENKNPHRN